MDGWMDVKYGMLILLLDIACVDMASMNLSCGLEASDCHELPNPVLEKYGHVANVCTPVGASRPIRGFLVNGSDLANFGFVPQATVVTSTKKASQTAHSPESQH